MSKRSYQAHASIADSSRRETDRRDTSQFGISMNESHSGMGYHEDRQMSDADMQQDQERLRTANNKALRVLITPDLPHTPEDDHRKPSSTSSVQPTTLRQLPKLAAHRRSFAIHANSRANSETALVVNTAKSHQDDYKKAVLHLILGFCLGVFATLLILGCMVVLIDPFDSNSTCTRLVQATHASNLTHLSPNS